MDEPSQPFILFMENVNGEEVALKIEQHDNFQIFLDKAKALLGFDVDLNSVTGNQPVSLHDNIYNFLINSELNHPNSLIDNFDSIDAINNADDLMYVLDDGTQIRASQIQFDNDDPIVDLTAEKIPFIKYVDEVDEKEPTEFASTKDINIVESPVQRWPSQNCSPRCSFSNSLPFKLICNNVSNFEAQFSKYLESSTKTYTNLNPVANRNKSPRSIIKDNYNCDSSLQNRNDILTREDILNMFKDSPVISLPYDENQNFEKRKHVRKTDPSRVVHKSWAAKINPEFHCNNNDSGCFICGKVVESKIEKLYLFDKEDQKLHRCEQKKISTQLKIICEQCLSENFKPSVMKSPSQSLNSDEYLVIKNNQQYIFQKTTSISLKSNFNSEKNIENSKTKKRNNVEFVKVEIGPDGEIITKPIDNDEGSDDVIIVNDEKKDHSSDVEIIEPGPEIDDIENLADADEVVKEFLKKYQCEGNKNDKELKCRFCEQLFQEIAEVIDHGEQHKHDLDEGTVFPCPLCEYGYSNYKWLKGHLNAAHNKPKTAVDAEDPGDGGDNDKENQEACSPVARRTRSAIKKNDTESDKGPKENNDTAANTTETSEPAHTFETHIKQECLDSSDEEGIWIVQAEDSADVNTLRKQVTDLRDGVIGPKCSNCSQTLPPEESLLVHKCRKRGRKRKCFAKDDSTIFVPSEEDFLKRAQGRPRPVGGSKDTDQMRSRKRKTKGPTSDPQIVTCHNCNESFTSKVRLKFHMQFHDTTNLLTADGMYLCAECDDVKFSSETKLFDHVHFQHDKQKRWQCPVKDCGKTFFLRATLTKHSRTHTDTRRYVCVTCGKRFLDKQTLDEHGVTHLQIKPFQCHICLKQLTRRSRLRMHLRAHEEELSPKLVLVCAVCSRAFRDHVDAQEHTARSTECLKEFTSELKEEAGATNQLSPTSGIVRNTIRVVEHPRLNKNIEREVDNEDSVALLTEVNDAARPLIRVVRIEKAFRCEYCEDVFYLEEALNGHRVIHKGVKNPFTCHICKVSFATYSRCTTHKTTHGFYKRSTVGSGPEVQSGPASAGILGYGGFPVVKHFLCEDCGRSYLHWTYLQVHRRMKHANETYFYKCNQCDVTFPNSWGVTYHRKKVHGKTGQDDVGAVTKIIRDDYRIPCRDCDEILPNKTELYKHRKKEHSDESLNMDLKDEWSEHSEDKGNTVCGQCGHNLHNVTALQKHIKEVHDNAEGRARVHTCSVCARVFRSASVRNEHLRVHTGERPYPCDLCGVAFRRSTAMRNHRLIHTGVRAWACALCPKRFRIRSDLRTHLRLKHPAHLAVLEIQGVAPTPEDVLAHLTLNNINQDRVIEISMISFTKGTTSIIPNSARALAMLSFMPRTQIACERPAANPPGMFPHSRRGRGIAKAPRQPKILQRAPGSPHDPQPYSLTVDPESLSALNVQLLLQESTLVNGNQMVELQLDDRMMLE